MEGEKRKKEDLTQKNPDPDPMFPMRLLGCISIALGWEERVDDTELDIQVAIFLASLPKETLQK